MDGTPTTLVAFVPQAGQIPDVIQFAPLLTTPVGEYFFKMTAIMSDYGYSSSHVFKAIVTPCAPLINPTAAQ